MWLCRVRGFIGVDVAEMVYVPDCDSGLRGFEFRRPPQ